MRALTARLDGVGMAASTLCAVHCAILPLVLGLLPVVGMGFVAHGAFEWSMVSFAGLVGAVSLARGHRVHRRHTVWCLFVPGLLLLLSGLVLFTGACCREPARFFGYDAARHEMVVVHSIPPPDVFPWRALVMATGGVAVAASHFLNMRFCRACRACHSECDSGVEGPEAR